MHYTVHQYWQYLQNLPAGHEDLPSERVCRLMVGLFERWRSPQAFPEWDCLGHMRDHVDTKDVMKESVAVRRGIALKKTLAWLVSEQAEAQGLCYVHPDELVVGAMPPYSVGQGKEIMAFSTDEEALEHEIRFLNGYSNFGHVVPNHEKVMRLGLIQIRQDSERLEAAATDRDSKDFYRSVRHALEGCLLFAEGYAQLARRQAEHHQRLLDELLERDPKHTMKELFEQRIRGMKETAERLTRIPAEPCRTFLDAVQCLYLMNCALHWTGELTSLGRLDQILYPYYKKEAIPKDQAQEIIDCLWVKLDERVILNARHLQDRFSSADGALLGAGGASNFDQGALANQWMQQVTLGGVKATDEDETEDASNDITRMCLVAARRFPFNCPTVDLRVHKDTPDDLFELAARALLSGGAHPVLMNDDKLVPRLHKHSGAPVALRSARNYACDGCFETLFPGETSFSFFYCPAVDVLEKALNSGAGFGASGASNLRGSKQSIRTLPARLIRDFEHFKEILNEHLSLSVHRQFAGVLGAIGSKEKVCPSPLLSTLITGCLESGRDFYGGGPRYHMFAPLMTGISTVADSLYVIKTLVFEQQLFSLEELVACLRCDWGGREEVIGMKVSKERAESIRSLCLAQPKFGTGQWAVDELAWDLIRTFVKAVDEARTHPIHQNRLNGLKQNYDREDHSFTLLLTPGIGTFEQYAFGGSFAGATPDGRKAGQSLGTDLSAAPVPEDRCPIIYAEDGHTTLAYARQAPLRSSMASWSDEAVNLLSDGAPSDFNIREDFPPKQLIDILRAFAAGHGSNMMTVTAANPETLRDAEKDPTKFELVRVRMGGWTEFFSVLSAAHKKHHRRRPIYLPT